MTTARPSTDAHRLARAVRETGVAGSGTGIEPGALVDALVRDLATTTELEHVLEWGAVQSGPLRTALAIALLQLPEHTPESITGALMRHPRFADIQGVFGEAARRASARATAARFRGQSVRPETVLADLLRAGAAGEIDLTVTVEPELEVSIRHDGARVWSRRRHRPTETGRADPLAARPVSVSVGDDEHPPTVADRPAEGAGAPRSAKGAAAASMARSIAEGRIAQRWR